MKKLVNGKYIDFTEEELKEIPKTPPPNEVKESIEERIDKLEGVVNALVGA